MNIDLQSKRRTHPYITSVCMIGLDRLNKWSEAGERTVALPSFLLSSVPYWLIISLRCRSHCPSINSTTSPPQPLHSRAYPFPLLYLTCSSGSQQTVKGQKAEAWEPSKYSNRCLSEEVRLVFHCQEQGRWRGFGAVHHHTLFHQNTAGSLPWCD